MSARYELQAGTPMRRTVDEVLVDLRAGERPREVCMRVPAVKMLAGWLQVLEPLEAWL